MSIKKSPSIPSGAVAHLRAEDGHMSLSGSGRVVAFEAAPLFPFDHIAADEPALIAAVLVGNASEDNVRRDPVDEQED